MKIRVTVKPNSKTEELTHEGDAFTIRVREPAREGKANKAVVRLLARYLGVPQSRVRIVSGLTCKNKVLRLRKSNRAR
jgi:uncharacterized protein (TIGR00251 family)